MLRHPSKPPCLPLLQEHPGRHRWRYFRQVMPFTQEKSRSPAHPPPPLRDPRRAAQQPSVGQPRRALAFIVSHRHHFCASLPPGARRLARLHGGSSALALNWGMEPYVKSNSPPASVAPAYGQLRRVLLPLIPTALIQINGSVIENSFQP